MIPIDGVPLQTHSSYIALRMQYEKCESPILGLYILVLSSNDLIWLHDRIKIL